MCDWFGRGGDDRYKGINVYEFAEVPMLGNQHAILTLHEDDDEYNFTADYYIKMQKLVAGCDKLDPTTRENARIYYDTELDTIDREQQINAINISTRGVVDGVVRRNQLEKEAVRVNQLLKSFRSYTGAGGVAGDGGGSSKPAVVGITKVTGSIVEDDEDNELEMEYLDSDEAQLLLLGGGRDRDNATTRQPTPMLTEEK